MMSWTKRQIIERAYEEIGLAAYVFDLQPEQVESARRKLDSMVAGWSSKNIQIGYPLPSEANSSDVDQDTNVPDYAIDALAFNLAIRIAPGLGKQISPDIRITAKGAYNDLLTMAVKNPPQMKYSCALPSGAGHKHRCDKFIINKQDNNVLSPNQDVEFFND